MTRTELKENFTLKEQFQLLGLLWIIIGSMFFYSIKYELEGTWKKLVGYKKS